MFEWGLTRLSTLVLGYVAWRAPSVQCSPGLPAERNGLVLEKIVAI